MTDADLIALLREKAPEELTLEEIEWLSLGLPQSLELRQALQERLLMDERLAGALGRMELSAEKLVSGAKSADRGSRAWNVFGFTATLLLVALAAWFTNDLLRDAPEGETESIAQVTPNQPGETPTKHSSETSPSGTALETGQPELVRRGVNPPSKALLIDAGKFARGDVVTVKEDEGAVNSQGRLGTFAEYEIDLPEAGEYQLQTRYAPHFSRPLRLSINGRAAKPTAAGEPAISVKRDPFQWFDEGNFTFQKGVNSLRFDASGYFPALSRLALVAVKDVPPREPLRLTIDARKFTDGNVIVAGPMIMAGPRSPYPYVEYQVESPVEAKFQLTLDYASERARPIRIDCNGAMLTRTLLLDMTGGGGPDHKQSKDLIALNLRKGTNSVRLATDGNYSRVRGGFTLFDSEHLFPHIQSLTLTEILSESPKQQLPWETAEQWLAPAKSWDEIALDGFPRNAQPPTTGELSRWLGENKWYEETPDRMRMSKLQGIFPIRAPWAADSLWRLAILNPSNVKLHFWRGQQGVTVQNYGGQNGMWAAYVTERSKLTEQRPTKYVSLAACDDERNAKANPGATLCFEMACQGGWLVFRRGDAILLRIPFQGLPEEVYLEGENMLLRGLQVARLSDHPAPLSAAEPTWKSESLDKQAWIKKLPRTTLLKFGEDGSAELVGEKLQEPAWASFPLPTSGIGPTRGLGEFIFQIVGGTAGGRVFLGNSQGEPLVSAGFVTGQRSKQIMLGQFPPQEQRREDSGDVENSLTPLADPPVWVRLVYGCGSCKVWLSDDGAQWVRCRQNPQDSLSGPATHVGLLLSTGITPASIRVKQIQFREYAAVTSLVPVELLAQAPLVTGGWPADWKKEVSSKRPATADAINWEIACLLRSLLGGPSKDPANNMVLRLAELGLPRLKQTSDRLKLLEELAQIADLFTDERALKLFLANYERVGRLAIAAGERNPCTRIANALLQAPIWASTNYPVVMEALARQEMFDLIYREQWGEASTFCRRLRMYGFAAAPSDPFLDWAEDAVAQRLGRQDFNAKLRPDRQHPFVEELSKDAFNVAAEFDSALQAQAYKDAAQIMSVALASETLGLLPAAADKRLYLSLRANLTLALQEHPDFQKTMTEQFGPVGQLRLRQAMAAGDSHIVEGVAAQFPNTIVAAEAQSWLGDRELTAGNLSAAGAWYRLARQAAGPNLGEQIAARQRLVAALGGRVWGSPATVPVDLGQERLEPAQFEQLVQQLRTTRASRNSGNNNAYQSPGGQAPAPARYTLSRRAAWDPQAFPNLKVLPENWSDWCLDGIAANAGLVFTNRSQIMAWNAKQNVQLWMYSLDGEAGSQYPIFYSARRPVSPTNPGDVSAQYRLFNTPFRPLVVDGKVISRLVGPIGPRLYAIDATTGKKLWESKSGLVLSDPVLFRDEIYALTIFAKGEELQVDLFAYDLLTGESRPRTGDARPRGPDGRPDRPSLCRLRGQSQGLRGGSLTEAEGQFVAVVGGVVIECDAAGRVNWLRKQEWISPGDDLASSMQVVQPALVDAGRVYVQQPGVKALEALSLDTGVVRWRTVLPTLRRIIGLADGRLILQTHSGIVALAADSGRVLWQSDFEQVHRAVLCGGPGGICVIAQDSPARGGTNVPTLTWLDPETGRIQSTCPLTELQNGNRATIGPLLQAVGKLWLWAGVDETKQIPQFYELQPADK